MNKQRNKIKVDLKIIFLLEIGCIILNCEGHGRLIEPPSRASAWRYGFSTLPDYNDHELYCGGFTRQWKQNGGKCGECGDAWDMPKPRPHENGGQWGKGLIVRRYRPGSKMMIRIELTASHMGFFEFRICPTPSAKQECFDQNVLRILGGSPFQPNPEDMNFRFYPRNGSRIYEIKAQLPEYTCDQCVLQWRYVAGNNWGMCSDGNGAIGCGPQEEFRSCSDIALTRDAQSPFRPLHPSILEQNITGTEPSAQNYEIKSLIYILISISILLILICLFLTIWFKFKDCKVFIKNYFLSCKKTKFVSKNINVKEIFKGLKCDNIDVVKDLNEVHVQSPPIPPPRTKKVKQEIHIITT
ncbi:uncharacterized protein LOC26514305 [Drosophila ananassae]|uniref:uncharacterized protein LOC26514305 n=1 Tax=Drosophila ananassae TaxID=7217 RepID=UPI0013A5D888|nr:uncharacterized protein LOC26514305 [Drosophila ananassae]